MCSKRSREPTDDGALSASCDLLLVPPARAQARRITALWTGHYGTESTASAAIYGMQSSFTRTKVLSMRCSGS